jgi:hypothetical protein
MMPNHIALEKRTVFGAHPEQRAARNIDVNNKFPNGVSSPSGAAAMKIATS